MTIPRIHPQFIFEVACDLMGVTMPEVMGTSKHETVVRTRSYVVKLCRMHTMASYPEIAVLIGRDNHSTVVTANNRVEKLMEDDPEVADEVDLLAGIIARRWREKHEPKGLDRTPRTRSILERTLGLSPGQLNWLSGDAVAALLDVLVKYPTLRDVLVIARLRSTPTAPRKAS